MMQIRLTHGRKPIVGERSDSLRRIQWEQQVSGLSKARN